MASYTHGNLAVKETYRQQAPKIQRNAKKDLSKKTLKLSALEKLVYIALTLVFTFFLGNLVLQNSQMYSINKNILDTKNNMKTTDVSGDELRKKLTDIKNPTALSAYADRLDFQPVTEDQKPSHNDESANEETASR